MAAAARHQEIETTQHSHSRGQLVVVVRGLITVGVESGIWIVTAGHSAWLPSYHRHSVCSHGPLGRSGAYIYIDESRCDRLSPYPGVIRTSALLREAALRIAKWPGSNDPLDAPVMSVVNILLDEIKTLPVPTFTLPLPRDPRLARVARALMDNPADGRDLDSWARLAGTSSRTLSRNFTIYTGVDFTAWRQRARLLRSLEMLAADLRISVIARDLGYATASAYISVFRRAFGETPADYRRRLWHEPPAALSIRQTAP